MSIHSPQFPFSQVTILEQQLLWILSFEHRRIYEWSRHILWSCRYVSSLLLQLPKTRRDQQLVQQHPLKTMLQWHFLVWHNYLPGTIKLSRGVSSLMIALGKTKAPVDSSKISGFEGDDGLLVKTTFAKWVGTDTFGGEPITSWVYRNESWKKELLYDCCRISLPLAISHQLPVEVGIVVQWTHKRPWRILLDGDTNLLDKPNLKA